MARKRRHRSADERKAMFRKMKLGRTTNRKPEISTKIRQINKTSTVIITKRKQHDPLKFKNEQMSKLENFRNNEIKKKKEVEKEKIDLENTIRSEVFNKIPINSQNESEISKITNSIKKIPPDKFVGLIATGISVSTGNPLPIMLYQSYKTLKIMKNIHDLMNNIKLHEELKNLAKINLEVLGQKILEKKTEEISKNVTEQFQNAGIIQNIATIAQYNENSVRTLFETTINNTIDSGIGNMTNWVVDTVL